MKKNTSIIITVIAVLTLAVVSLVQVFALDIHFNDELEQSTVQVEIVEVNEITTAPVTTQVIDEIEEETQAEIAQEIQDDEITTARVITETQTYEEEEEVITTAPVSRTVDETEQVLLENGLTQEDQDKVDEVLAQLNEEGFGNEQTNAAIEDWLVYSIVVLQDEDATTQTDDESIDFSGIDLSQFVTSEGEATISGSDSWVLICETVQDVFGEEFFNDVAYTISGQWALDWFHDLF